MNNLKFKTFIGEIMAILFAKALKFEQIVSKILSSNYKFKQQEGKIFDFITSNNVGIEIKYLQQNNFQNVLYFANEILPQKDFDSFILVTNLYGCKQEFQNYLNNHCNKEIHIITLENLLYLCDKNNDLKSQLLKCIEFSTDNILPLPPDESITRMLQYDRIEATHLKVDKKCLTDELKSIEKGFANFAVYQKFCKKFLEKMFENNLGEIIEQRKNNKDCHRFDLIAPFKTEPKNYWKFLYDKYKSFFILFECKNYNEPIKQDQIYLTERYLYDNALRNVAIILTRCGGTKSAIKASQDILKEHGKLILIFDDNDLIELEKCYIANYKNPNLPNTSDFLMNKTIDFLLNLDK